MTDVSHIWRSRDHDHPCTPTGVEWRDDADGRIYVQVKTPDGTEHVVPKDELVAQGGNGTAIMTDLEITLLAKDGGPLTKRITLGKDGMP